MKAKKNRKLTIRDRPLAPFSVLSVISLVILAIFVWEINRKPSPVYSANAMDTQLQEMVVYKSPSCGCCGKWVKHMERASFKTSIKHPENLSAIKDKYVIDANLQSCHTAVIDGYVFEGHIPADVIRTFLSEKPNAIGLTVPGMPVGSPGMEVGMRKDSFDILLMKRNGETSVYASR